MSSNRRDSIKRTHRSIHLNSPHRSHHGSSEYELERVGYADNYPEAYPSGRRSLEGRVALENVYDGSEYYPGKHVQSPLRRDSSASTAVIVPFATAAKKLTSVLVDGLRLLEEAKQEFEEDIQKIKVYVDPKMVDTIWIYKLFPYHGGPGYIRGANEDADVSIGDEGNIPPAKEYETVIRRLKYAFRDVCNASLLQSARRRSTTSITRGDDERRTQKKLKEADKECMELCSRAGKHYSQVEALIKEMDFTLKILDGLNKEESTSEG
ncbi:hypothetical protein M501DRAFT_1061406 [Patellaria atrata CBS 101060]|uniref:Uncharacterized protein n=1 Tax=Patellaria atrata CBS 101060 TaxID=1346257 RepID=A0A9P4VMN2_9PEZI|nr:hypothetical protein M501DRAFT_1061406 [Patellaria atrata CBS 101060]